MATKTPPQTQPTPPVSPESAAGPFHPGGVDSPAYRFAFNAFVILFLLLVCIGLAMYLGWYLKARTG